MKKTTKLTAVILSVITAFSCLCVFAFAADCTHDYKATIIAPNCAEKGYTLWVCPNCGDNYKTDYTDALGHAWGNWQVIDSATCTAEGHEQRTCIICNSFETKTISVTEHVDANQNGECDTCGMEMKLDYILNPYDWLKAFIEFLINWFRGIFA